LFLYILSQFDHWLMIFIYSISIWSLINDFHKLILYPSTLLKLFMVSSRFWVEFFGSLRYRMMSSANRNFFFTVYLSICMAFISSSCLIPLARNAMPTLFLTKVPKIYNEKSLQQMLLEKVVIFLQKTETRSTFIILY
jgi:hypothetical protein